MKNLLTILVLFLHINLGFSQSNVTGKITDANGQVLIGATVQLLETKQGTATDLEGTFELTNVQAGNYTLISSYVGYETLRRPIAIPPNTASVNLDLRLQERPIAFDQIVVKSTRATEKLPITYTNVENAEIQERNLGQDIPFILKWTPSTVVTSDAGTGIGYTGLRIRGIDPTRINVTVNGVPLNDSESQGVFWVNMPDFATTTNSIQIQRGVGTSTNGPAAFGASLNLNTAVVNRESYGSVSATVGSFNTRRGNIAFGTGLIDDKFTLDGRLSTIDSDGYIDRASVDLNSYYLSGAYVGRKSSLRFNTFSGHEITYQAWNGVPAQFIDNAENEELRTFNTAGTDRPGEPHDNEVDNYRQTHYQVLFNSQLNRNWDLSWTGNYTKGMGFFELYKGGRDLVDYNIAPITIGTETITESDLIERRWLDNDFYFTSAAANYESDNQKLSMNFGTAFSLYKGDHFGEVIWARFSGDTEQGHRYYENDATKTDFNIFTKASYQLTEKLTGFADLQYRKVDYEFQGLDRNSNNEVVNITENVDFNFINPKLGLTYEFDQNTSLYAYFGVGNKEPNRNDFTDSSPTTRPAHETVYDTELGFKKGWKKVAIEANLYFMDYNNQLVATGQINDVGASTRINVKDSYRAGLELAGGWQMTSQLMLEGAVTLSDNKINNFTEFIDVWDTGGQVSIEHGKTDLAFSPSTIFNAGLTFDALPQSTTQDLIFSWDTKYIGEQFIDNTSNANTRLPSYSYSDLNISYSIQTAFVDEIAFTLLIRNLFDAKYISNAWTYRYISESFDGRPFDPTTRLEQGSTYNLTGYYPQAGRNFLLGVTLSF
ncbi:MAG: TonB-dependent receptor [Bacteroidota bacterium]